MAKILRTRERRSFKEISSFEELVEKMEENYKWVRYKTADAVYVPLNDNPVCLPYMRDEMPVSEDPRDERRIKISKEVSNDTLLEAMEETKVCLQFPLEESMVCYPVAPTALRGVYERVGLNCPVMTSLSSTTRRDEASPYNKALAYDALRRYTKGETLIRLGDETILANLSSEYVIVSMKEVFLKTKETLFNEFESVDFVSGDISHETSSVEYKFYDSETDDAIFNAYSAIGIDTSKYSTHIKLLSSDVGMSGVNIYPFLRSSEGSILPIGLPIKMEHTGDANVEKVVLNLKAAFSMYKRIGEILEKLSNIKINNPSSTLYNIGKKASLAEKPLRSLAEEFNKEYPYNCNGVDVYRKLFELFDKLDSSKYSDLQLMQTQEMITRSLFYHLSEYDKPSMKDGEIIEF